MSSILASLQNHWKSAKTLTASAVNATKQALCKGLDLAIEALKCAALQGARLLLFVPLVLLRGLAVILLVLATVAPITLPILVLGALVASPDHLESLKETAGLPLQATAIVLALGILGNLFLQVLNKSWSELKSIFSRAWKNLRNGPWKPCWEIGRSVCITRECVLAKIRPNLECSVKSSWRLMGWLAAGILLASIAYPSASSPSKHHVVVANMADADQEITTEVVKVYMRAGAVFSLAYAENAQPQTGAGICLNEYQQRWLDMYRAAIVECLKLERKHNFKRESLPVFEVTAFASIAPAGSKGNVGGVTSDMTNCEIANLRAKAVGALLEGKGEKKWLCDNDGGAEGVAKEFNSKRQGDFCEGKAIEPKEVYVDEGDDGLRFKILVNQWDEPESMKEHKQVDDGRLPEDRRYRVEMFNRSVYISVEEDFCRTRASDDALSDVLRERRVTVPYFPADGGAREGFVRVVNRSDENGHVFIEAIDDAGVRTGPVRLSVRARQAVHFDSAGLENGNMAKGLDGIGAPPTAGDWRLSVISALDVEVLSYIRTEDGFLTAMHDVVPDAMAPLFNPGGARQRSILRTVNMEAEPVMWTTGGYDDRGRWHRMPGSVLVRPQQALTLTADALEDAHSLGDGDGRWRLRVRGFRWFAMSLLENPTGHLTNLSTVPDNATRLPDGRTMHKLPLFPVADGSREGIVRVINRSDSSGEVTIEAVDDAGARFGPVQVAMARRRAVELTTADLALGNVEKGLVDGLGVGDGDWRLEIASELELMVLSYVQTADGFFASLHDVAPVAEDGSHRVVFFKPGSNRWQVSKLRLVNDSERAASVRVAGIDDNGVDSGTVTLTVPAGSALALTSAELEAGSNRLAGSLGDGYGQWRLRVHSDEPITVMSLLETPGDLLANMSTGTAD